MEHSLENLKCIGITGLKKVEDPLEDQLLTTSLLVKIWENIYHDTELDDTDETKEILSKVKDLEKTVQKIDEENQKKMLRAKDDSKKLQDMEASIAKIASVLEEISSQVKTSHKDDHN